MHSIENVSTSLALNNGSAAALQTYLVKTGYDPVGTTVTKRCRLPITPDPNCEAEAAGASSSRYRPNEASSADLFAQCLS
jgi:hypothetical protein